MADLPERLRTAAGPEVATVMLEAADEIERLRTCQETLDECEGTLIFIRYALSKIERAPATPNRWLDRIDEVARDTLQVIYGNET